MLAATTYAFAATFVLLKLIGLVMPLRATASEEAIGMDIIAHGEEAYATGTARSSSRSATSRSAAQRWRWARTASTRRCVCEDGGSRSLSKIDVT